MSELDNSQTNLLEDIVYEKYDKRAQPIPEKDNPNASESGGTPGMDTASTETGATVSAEPDQRELYLDESLFEGKILRETKKKARFSDRVKINQAMRLIMEIFLQENVKEQEFLIFFGIPLDTYLDYIHSSRTEALYEIISHIVNTIEEMELDKKRMDDVVITLNRTQLLVDKPESLWQIKIAALTRNLGARLGYQAEQPLIEDTQKENSIE